MKMQTPIAEEEEDFKTWVFEKEEESKIAKIQKWFWMKK